MKIPILTLMNLKGIARELSPNNKHLEDVIISIYKNNGMEAVNQYVKLHGVVPKQSHTDNFISFMVNIYTFILKLLKND